MKKILVFGLAFLLLATASFADDAKVMPGLVGRLYMAPIFSFAPGAYDSDGELKKFDDGAIKLFNLGFALEFGITDWITAALQWVPGVTLWSDIKPALPFPVEGDVNTNGVGDLFAGTKIQIIGEKAPVENEIIRFAVAPGVIIPMPGPDFEEEVKNANDGKTATLNNMDKHVFAAGGRFYFDYIFNKNFFINLYNETIFYPVKQDMNKAGPNFFLTKAGVAAAVAATPTVGSTLAAGILDAKGEIDHKYRLTFEIEPVFTTFIADGISFTAGLPINFRYTAAPEYSISVSLPDALKSQEAAMEKALSDQFEGKAAQVLSINPNASMFFMTLPLPMEFKFQYNIPVWGENTNAQHNLAFQIRAYFAFR